VGDAVRVYVEALKDRQKAERAVREVVDFVKYVSNALERDVSNFSFDAVARLGPPVSRTASPTYDSAKWPSAKGLQELLIAWDDSRRRVQDAWDALDAEDRTILPGPDRRN
jgi:hypothetical protein